MTFIASSEWWQWPRVLDVVKSLAPQRVLDVGAGHGIMGAMLREAGVAYVAGCDLLYDVYVPRHAAAYDRLYAATLPFVEVEGRYDLAIMSECIEHLTKQDGASAVNRLLLTCDRVLITTPLGFRQQDSTQLGGSHKSGWWPWDFFGWRVVRMSIYPTRRSRFLRLPRGWQMLVVVV